jgi:hypothetical protein
MKDLHTQASIFYLRDVHCYSQEDAEEKSENVILYKGTVEERAADYLAEVVESGLVKIPEAFSFYFTADAEKFAYEAQQSGDWVQFEFAKQQWTCVNRNDL